VINFSCYDNFINFRNNVKCFYVIKKNVEKIMTFVIANRANYDKKRAQKGALWRNSFIVYFSFNLKNYISNDMAFFYHIMCIGNFRKGETSSNIMTQ
jgi:hypothetical protein